VTVKTFGDLAHGLFLLFLPAPLLSSISVDSHCITSIFVYDVIKQVHLLFLLFTFMSGLDFPPPVFFGTLCVLASMDVSNAYGALRLSFSIYLSGNFIYWILQVVSAIFKTSSPFGPDDS